MRKAYHNAFPEQAHCGIQKNTLLLQQQSADLVAGRNIEREVFFYQTISKMT